MQFAEVDAVRARRTLDDDVRGFAEQFRAEHDQEHAGDHEDEHGHEAHPFLAEEFPEPADRVAEPLALLGRDADATAGPEGRPPRLRAGGGQQLLVVLEGCCVKDLPVEPQPAVEPRPVDVVARRGTVARNVRSAVAVAVGAVAADVLEPAHATTPLPSCESTISA